MNFMIITVRPLHVIVLLMTAAFAGCGAAPDSPEVNLERARILMERDQAAEAIPILNEVINASPKDPEARYQRGVAYESLDVLEKALIDYTECLSLDADRTDALNNKAVVLAKMARFEDAAVEFTRLVDLDPQGPLAYRNRGLCHFDLGEYDAALADYAKALELAPAEPANWFQRAGVYLKQRRFEEAEKDYSKAIELDPEFAKAWMNRGVARYNRGEMKLAAEDLQEAQLLDDDIVVPDIDFFSRGSENISDGVRQTQLWASGRALAEQELTKRGFINVTIVSEYPTFRCAEFSAELDGQPWQVLLAWQTPEQDYVTLPRSVTDSHSSLSPGSANSALLVLQSPEEGSAAEVRRFEKPWNPANSDGEPVILRYPLKSTAQ